MAATRAWPSQGGRSRNTLTTETVHGVAVSTSRKNSKNFQKPQCKADTDSLQEFAVFVENTWITVLSGPQSVGVSIWSQYVPITIYKDGTMVCIDAQKGRHSFPSIY